MLQTASPHHHAHHRLLQLALGLVLLVLARRHIVLHQPVHVVCCLERPVVRHHVAGAAILPLVAGLVVSQRAVDPPHHAVALVGSALNQKRHDNAQQLLGAACQTRSTHLSVYIYCMALGAGVSNKSVLQSEGKMVK